MNEIYKKNIEINENLYKSVGINEKKWTPKKINEKQLRSIKLLKINSLMKILLDLLKSMEI